MFNDGIDIFSFSCLQICHVQNDTPVLTIIYNVRECVSLVSLIPFSVTSHLFNYQQTIIIIKFLITSFIIKHSENF